MADQEFSGVGWHAWDVPKNLEWVTIDLRGAGSNVTTGGRVQGRINVKNTDRLLVLIGEAGHAPVGKTGGVVSTGGGGRGGNAVGTGTKAGWGGGGASYIRKDTKDGSLRAVAGGAAGQSGEYTGDDVGEGGRGGASTGEHGWPGVSGPFPTGNATGGTQTQPGQGGTSDAGAGLWGGDAATDAVGRGGHGGDATNGHGGGGGGGGYRAGGGGQASSLTYAPAGGGGGGSNYTGGLIFASGGGADDFGGGGTGNGYVKLVWQPPAAKNDPPNPPSDLKVDGRNEADALATQNLHRVVVSGKVTDPNKDKCRIVVRYSKKTNFSDADTAKDNEWVENGKRSAATLTGLAANTRYYVRAYTEDRHGKLSQSYNTTNFWTDRKPVTVLQYPVDNSQFSVDVNMTFDWRFTDPDSTNATQKAYRFRYRTAPTANEPAGVWQPTNKTTSQDDNYAEKTTSFDKHVVSAGEFAGNTFYEWTVRTQDGQGLWGDWADPYSFYVTSPSTPPKELIPKNDVAVDVLVPNTFTWKFLDPQPNDKQCKADVRYRVKGSDIWIEDYGTYTVPGATEAWTFPPNTFAPGYRYEWQVRTLDGGPDCTESNTSPWSLSATFHTILTPGHLADSGVVPDVVDVQESLGCGVTRVFVYHRGGQVMFGEITPLTTVTWTRKRDAISNCTLATAGFGPECGALLGDLRCWMHELVVFRDGQRVWEGPITRLTYTADNVEMEAQDVMAYVYRRVMRQGYNDTYHLSSGEQLGRRTVIQRAGIIVQNALAPDDPNVLPYMTLVEAGTDATQSRVVPDYSRTAWEEIDDLAATAGLDYTTVGRRIVFWDTHRQIGRLPEMRDGDFSNPPIVSEYGMQLANYFAVTNNNGVHGEAVASVADPKPGKPDNRTPVPTEFYGRIELLASAYGETAAAADAALTAAARQSLEKDLNGQAQRNIAGRWPSPVVVRVPDNSALNPTINLSIQHLVPGVWIPLRATQTVRKVAQWQKLDSITVVASSDSEQVQVVMSPAPLNADVDLDATTPEGDE